MKLALVNHHGVEHVVQVQGGKLHALDSAVSLLDLVSGRQPSDGVPITDLWTGDVFGPEEVEFSPPVPSLATRIFCVGLNYMDHFLEGYAKREGLKQPPRYPTYFYKAPQVAIGHEGQVPLWDHVSRQLDYEAELAVVVGRMGRDIARDDATEFVFGYTIANDLTYRDVQRRHGGQWTKGKTMDATCPLGPYITTKDEWQPGSATISCLVNGEVRQESSVDNMLFTIPEIIESLSAGLTLYEGDIILTGTPAGVGYAQDPPSFLTPGDTVETYIQGLGILLYSIVPRNAMQ